MSAIPSIGQYTLVCNSYTAFVGKQFVPTMAERLGTIDDDVKVITSMDALSLEEVGEYRRYRTDLLRQQINDDFQSHVRLGTPLDSQAIVLQKKYSEEVVQLSSEWTGQREINLLSEIGLGNKGDVYTIFEKHGRTYINAEEEKSWFARIVMLEVALATTRVFSISIIPSNPMELQTWYHKAVTSCKAPRPWMIMQPSQSPMTLDEKYEMIREMGLGRMLEQAGQEETFSSASSSSSSSAVEAHQNLFEVRPPTPAFDPNTSSTQEESPDPIKQRIQVGFSIDLQNYVNGWYKSHGSDYTSSAQKESPDSPAPICGGFFTPFPGFSSDFAHPQYDPDHLPRSVICVNALSPDEMDRVMGGLENDSIRNSIGCIVDAFIEDEHSRNIGLVVLEPRNNQIKTLFFNKVY